MRHFVLRLAISVGLIALVLAVCLRLRYVDHATVALLMVLAIVAIARAWGWEEALVASLAGGIGFDYYFLPPRGFGIANPEHWVALTAFLATAVAASRLAAVGRTGGPRVRSREVPSLLLALLIVAVSATVAFRTWAAFNRSSEQAARTRQVLDQTDDLLASLRDAEAGQRGFLLTGRDEYLEPYHQAVQKTPVLLNGLESLAAAGRDGEVERIEKLKPLVMAKLDELERAVELRQSQGPDAAAALVLLDRGKDTMDLIRGLCAEITAASDRRLAQESGAADSNARRLELISTGGSGVLLVILILSTITIQRGTQQREKLIEDLEEGRQLLTTFVRRVPAAVAMLDRELRYVEASDKWCGDYGVDRASMLGRKHDDISPDMPEHWKELHRRGLAGETLQASEELFQRADGRRMWLRWEIRPWGNREGRPEGILVFSEDITEHKEAEELKAAVLDAIAHELRNPLNSVKLAATTLLSGQWGSDSHRQEMLTIIDQEATRMDQFIDEAVQAARMEASKAALQTEPQSMAALITDAIEEMGALASRRPIEVSVPESLPAAECNRDMIRMVLKQLLNNALKYSPDGSPLQVSANLVEGAIVIDVVDQGPGVAEDERERIFEKFYRGRAARLHAAGTGLGLASAKSIVLAHGGEIWVTAPAGGGAAFHFSLPAARASQAVGAA